MTAKPPTLRPWRIPALLAAAFAWSKALEFGDTYLDTIYGRLLNASQTIAAVQYAFHEVGDALLFLAAFTVLLGVLAVFAALNASAARNWFLASLALEALLAGLPMLLSFDPNSAQAVSSSATALRLALSGLSSFFAFAGLFEALRTETESSAQLRK